MKPPVFTGAEDMTTATINGLNPFLLHRCINTLAADSMEQKGNLLIFSLINWYG